MHKQSIEVIVSTIHAVNIGVCQKMHINLPSITMAYYFRQPDLLPGRPLTTLYIFHTQTWLFNYQRVMVNNNIDC